MCNTRNTKKTCLNLELSSLATCDKCKKFKERLDYISSRKPSKNAVPNFEKLWSKKTATHRGRLLIQERAHNELWALGFDFSSDPVKHKLLTCQNLYFGSGRGYCYIFNSSLTRYLILIQISGQNDRNHNL